MPEESGSWRADDDERGRAGRGSCSHAGAGCAPGLAWSGEIDLEELLAAITGQDGHEQEGQESGACPQSDDTGQLAGQGEDQEAALDAELEAVQSGRAPELTPAEMAGLAAGRMPPGPGLAALLAAAPPADLADYALPDMAAAYRRLGSWAQASELACVAQLAARSAGRDPRAGTGADGRPAYVTREACAEVSLALTMTGVGAQWWTDLAVTLCWQLPATGAALRAGRIDLARARLIAEATCLLEEEAARAVEDKILPGAGDQTTGALRAALRRAVIAADPAGAERRRAEAERRARVVLYPEAESTATLAGQGLPGPHAATAMAKIKAMARGLKASGAPGSIDFLCAQVYIGLLLGTLPPIPRADGAPGDEPPGDEPPGDDENPADEPWPDAPTAGRDDDPGPGTDGPCAGQDSPDSLPDGSEQGDEWEAAGPEPAWPDLPGSMPPGPAAGTGGHGPYQAARGLLDLAVPWATLAGLASEPGWLGRLGPITPLQARRLAELASRDRAAKWQIIVLGPSGQARAIAKVPRQRDGPVERGSPGHRDGPVEHRSPGRSGGPGRSTGSHGTGAGLIGRVTLTICDTILDRAPPEHPGPAGGLGQILAAARRAAGLVAARADATQAADTLAGGCAHHGATAAYRPPPSVRDQVTARDVTCRFPTCRQPATQGDLDHTLAWDQGGLTCRCNLGGVCRTHHKIKQHPLWTLRQDTPGNFTWITHAGHTYTVSPDVHPA